MRFNAYGRLLRLAAFVIAGVLLFVATSSAERGRPSSKKSVCTHGASSIGPVYIRDGKVVGGVTTPHTEACLR
jgi:hypothetical protein